MLFISWYELKYLCIRYPNYYKNVGLSNINKILYSLSVWQWSWLLRENTEHVTSPRGGETPTAFKTPLLDEAKPKRESILTIKSVTSSATQQTQCLANHYMLCVQFITITPLVFVEKEIWQQVRMCQAPLGLFIFDKYDIRYITAE